MAYAYTTPGLIQAELRSSTPFGPTSTPSDTTIQEWIYEESAYINGLANTVFGSTSQVEYVDYRGEEDIVLENSPVLSVTSVEYNTNPVGSSLGASWVAKSSDVDYVLYSDRGIIRIVFSNWSPSQGSKRIRITYTSGYTTIPYDVQKLATKLVTERVMSTLIAKNVNERNDGGSVSVGSISIVEPASYGVASYKQLKNDIEGLKREILGKSFSIYRFAHI